MSIKYLQLLLYLICGSGVLRTHAVHKLYNCMSFMEDDHMLLDDDDEESEEYAVNKSQYDINSFREKYDATSTISGDLEDNHQHLVSRLRSCPADYTFCFALWRQTENTTVMEKQGCWKESVGGNAACNNSKCVSTSSTSRNNSLYYCCCAGDACNSNVTIILSPPIMVSDPLTYVSVNINVESLNWSTVQLWLLVIAACLLITMLSLFLYYRSSREKTESADASLPASGPGYSSNLRNVDNLNLICMLGSGKYGTVMKGMLHGEEVAVKIFPDTHQQYFINERSIYSLPLMECSALLNYFGYDEKHTLEGRIEYLLVLSLAPLGCLQDWLITNILSFEIFCKMMTSITRGLSHLHTELRRNDKYKPCIAHRDFNTRNILVKADYTCCISDFGFALKVFGSRYEYKGELAEAETKSFNEVGTLRYMAPELLEGAVNLRDCETSLKQMDVYALGLVLWEVATRCSDFYSASEIIPPYKAPYEAEVGLHPTFDQMQNIVVRRKCRPLFPSSWCNILTVKLLRDTCEDCWDHDSEARLTSLCAEERMQEIATLGLNRNNYLSTISPLLNTHNLCKESVDHTTENNLTAHCDNSYTDTTNILHSPTNQRRCYSLHNFSNGYNVGIGKNHLIKSKDQLQPPQGRNSCLERNLVPHTMPSTNKNIQNGIKHNSHSYNITVEEFKTKKNLKVIPKLTTGEAAILFSKQQNAEHKLKGWREVRALIEKRLFRKTDVSNANIFHHSNVNEEKSTLIDNHQITVLKAFNKTANPAVGEFADVEQNKCETSSLNKQITEHSSCEAGKRPNNLDLSPLNGLNNSTISAPNMHSAQISVIHEEDSSNNDRQDEVYCRKKNVERRMNTTSHKAFPQTKSATSIPTVSNYQEINRSTDTELKVLIADSACGFTNERNYSISEPQFKRQNSEEIFREVFGVRGSCERLRDPSQRVKTPGDVPPSVRRLRASKTLSLYDDRMMDSSTFNVL